MLFGWFNAKEAQQLGTELAHFFIGKLPKDATYKDRKFAVKTQNTLAKIEIRLRQFREKQTLNIYTRAKLANTFQWTLKDAGYEAAYIDELTEWLVKRL